MRQREAKSDGGQASCLSHRRQASCLSHRRLTCSLLVAGLAGLLAVGAAAGAPAEDPSGLVARAQKLIEDGKQNEAETVLLEAVKAGPRHVPAFLALAELYESMDRKEEAMELYGHVLSRIDARQQRARDRFRRLFYDGRFPRELRFGYLKHGPVAFDVDQCRLSDEFRVSADPVRRFAYTTSLIFPEELTRGKAAPWVRLPPSSGTYGNSMYNRVCYGVIADPGTEIMRTRWVLGYPSPTILLSSGEYSSLAGRLLQVVLRGHIYSQEYLGLERRPAQGDLLRVFLSEDGPTGAEQIEDKIFFYDVDHDREPLEWLREALHEVGHMLLPRVGPFEGDERWGNGDLGERLLFQWLLEEAGLVTQGPWPSGAAAEALDQMWSGGHVRANDYLLERCRLPLGAWLATAPEGFEDRDGIERFAGFCLWVQAAHGRKVLAAMLGSSEGTAPSDYMTAYKKIVSKVLAEGVLRLDAGALNPVGSKLIQPAREGAVRRELIALGQDGHVTYRAYLPAGDWTLTLEHSGGAEAALKVTLDGARELAGDGNAAMDLGETAEGWHDIQVVCGSPGPVELVGLEFRAAK